MTKPAGTSPKKTFTRFSLLQRLQHFIFLISFSTLGFTGLPQKYPTSPISIWFFNLTGGVEIVREIHHISAIVMVIISLVHVLQLLYSLVVLRTPISMIPWINDLQHVYDDVLYYLGLRKHKAYYGRYSYAEKAEYLALIWGTVVMALTGFMMWNPLLTVNFLPGEAIPAAKAAHGGEAVLAVLAIIIWHFYHVHIKTLNKSMFTGSLSRKEMEHEHPAELAILDAEKPAEAIPAKVLFQRQLIFAPLALVILVAFGFGFYYFVGYETTALAVAPQGETAQVFVPITPTPVSTSEAASEPLTWKNFAGPLIQQKCVSCHHGLSASGGLDLSTYADALKGGKKGPAIVPNSLESSVIITAQSAGIHPGQMTADELVKIKAWITAGAPESEATTAETTPPTAPDWGTFAGPLFQQKCAACHGTAASGGLNLSTYAEALKGGKSGPGIVPKTSAESQIVKTQAAGGHPSTLTAEELAKVKEWIDAGAPETASSTTPATAPAVTAPAAVDWQTLAGPLFQQNCAACHGAAAMGGLNLSTYADALKGGKDGAVILPKASAESKLILIQTAGGHPGQLTAEDLAKIKEWIDAGAPETGTAAPAVTATAVVDWQTLAGPIFQQNCAACHGAAAMGGLNLSTYADALKGGKDGAVILPKSGAESKLILIQTAGGHPGQLTAEDLAKIKEWIDAGALETGTAAPALEAAPAALTWEAYTGPLVQQKCAACHGAAAMGGLNLSTYAEALKGGKNGAVILPKYGAESKLILVQTAGGHPGQFTAEELDQIKAWIEAGALEK